MASVKESIKDSIVGNLVPESVLPITTRIKAHFQHHARADSETGERYMNEEDFINAIAPVHEDYVSFPYLITTLLAVKESFTDTSLFVSPL